MAKQSIEQLIPSDSTFESIRRFHLRQESGIKSIGQLCFLVAFFSLLGTGEFLLFAFRLLPRDDFQTLLPDSLLDLFLGLGTIGFAINTLAQIILGLGLIQLRFWARWTVIVLTGLSLCSGTISSLALCMAPPMTGFWEPLIGFDVSNLWLGLGILVVGGAIHLLILWPMIAPGSSVVFSGYYQEVIRATPEIKSRMHWLLKLVLGCLMILVMGFIAYLLAIYFRFID